MRIATVRLRSDERTQAYAARRRAEGKTNREILRCLKRHIAREVHRLLTDPPEIPHGADLRRRRTQHGLTLAAAAEALDAATSQISALERGLHHNRRLAERYQQHLAEIALDKHRSIVCCRICLVLGRQILVVAQECPSLIMCWHRRLGR